MFKRNLPFQLKAEQYALIETRLKEFKQKGLESNAAWFAELCFCLLTANAQAKKALEIEKAVGIEGFLEKSEEELVSIIRTHKHRFHNTKAKYIVAARKYKNIKSLLRNKSTHEAREFLITHILGMGYKEASHFLRNVGYSDCAIIDRHIIRFLLQYKLISSAPKVITKKIYLQLEDIIKQFMPLNQLDLMIWCHMTNTILK